MNIHSVCDLWCLDLWIKIFIKLSRFWPTFLQTYFCPIRSSISGIQITNTLDCLILPYRSLIQFSSFSHIFVSFLGICLTWLHTNPFFCGGHFPVKPSKVLDFSYFIFFGSRISVAFVLWFPFPYLFTYFPVCSCNALTIFIIAIVKLSAPSNSQVFSELVSVS